MPIHLAPLNVELRIVKVLANEKIKKHLESLGILTNARVTVISSDAGSVVLQVKEGRLALDRDISNKILVA